MRLVQSSPFGGSNNLAPGNSVTLPNPPKIGNLLLALAKATPSAGAMSIPNFAVDALQIGNTTHYMGMFKEEVDVGQSQTIVLTDSATPTTVQLSVAAFEGVKAAEDATMVSTNGGATLKTSQATGNITTTTPDCLLVAYLGLQTANTATSFQIDWGTGASIQTIAVKANQHALAYRFVHAAGTYGATWSWPTASRVTTAIKAFQGTPDPGSGIIGLL